MNREGKAMIWLIFYVLAFFSRVSRGDNLDAINASKFIKNIDKTLERAGYFLAQGDVRFLLFTRDNPKEFVELDWENMDVVSSSRLVKVIIHGWGENANRMWYEVMKNEYLRKSDYSVIEVDWSKPATNTYSISSMNTKLVGVIISQFLMGLANEVKIPYDNIHLIGHSLGAHVAGFAGQSVYKSTKTKLYRVTGLDPAGPLFENVLVGKYDRLNDEDAKIVDVIHTDGGVFGFSKPVGTVDFYPNGGFGLQPGCSVKLDVTSKGYLDTVFCSHTRSYKIFSEAINNATLRAVKCPSYYQYVIGLCDFNEIISVSAEEIGKNITGSYYLKTDGKPPYLW